MAGIDAEIRSGKLRSSDIVSEVLVHASSVKISHIRGDPLGQLTVEAHSRLQVSGGMEMRVDGVEGLRRVGIHYRDRVDRKCGIR